MDVCEHKFGLKKRLDGRFYCPVCRQEMYAFADLYPQWINTDRHPYTCGDCKWEGKDNIDYLEHCVVERHGNWETIIANTGQRRSSPFRPHGE